MNNKALEALAEAQAQAEREDGAREGRGMVKGLKALFKGGESWAHLPGEYTDENEVQRVNRRVEDIGPKLRPLGGYERHTDPPRPGPLATVPVDEAKYPALADQGYRVPGPWAGVPAALAALRPTGRYDRVTDDAWHLLNAFVQARTQDRQDPATYNRVQGPEGS